ncbi:hypothetical protein HDU93_000527 [Gonapodya sp. JEL0774]|nr:hypothetical protein HDU93_000527 [Gonapodya sp. JEL0774]
MLDGYARAGDSVGLRNVLEEMKARGVDGDAVTWNVVLRVQAMTGDVAQGLKLAVEKFTNGPSQHHPARKLPGESTKNADYEPEDIANSLSGAPWMGQAPPMKFRTGGMDGKSRSVWSQEEMQTLEETGLGVDALGAHESSAPLNNDLLSSSISPEVVVRFGGLRQSPSGSSGTFAPLNIDSWGRTRSDDTMAQRERAELLPTMDIVGSFRRDFRALPESTAGLKLDFHPTTGLPSLDYATPGTFVALIDLLCRQTVPDIAGARGFLCMLLERFPGTQAGPALTKYLWHLSQSSELEKVVEEFENFTGTPVLRTVIPATPGRNFVPPSIEHIDVVIGVLASHPGNFADTTTSLLSDVPPRLALARRMVFDNGVSDVRLFNHLIRAFMKRGDRAGVESLREEMKKRGVQENIFTATVLMQGGMDRTFGTKKAEHASE